MHIYLTELPYLGGLLFSHILQIIKQKASDAQIFPLMYTYIHVHRNLVPFI